MGVCPLMSRRFHLNNITKSRGRCGTKTGPSYSGSEERSPWTKWPFLLLRKGAARRDSHPRGRAGGGGEPRPLPAPPLPVPSLRSGACLDMAFPTLWAALLGSAPPTLGELVKEGSGARSTGKGLPAGQEPSQRNVACPEAS